MLDACAHSFKVSQSWLHFSAIVTVAHCTSFIFFGTFMSELSGHAHKCGGGGRDPCHALDNKRCTHRHAILAAVASFFSLLASAFVGTFATRAFQRDPLRPTPHDDISQSCLCLRLNTIAVGRLPLSVTACVRVWVG